MKKVAVYPGVFDPLTVGHVWVIKESLKLCDELIVAIAVNPEKKPMFSLEERLSMLSDVCKDMNRVRIANFEKKFLVRYAKEQGATCIIRSVRTESDYEYERVLNHVNRDIAPDITTVFLMPPRGISEVSSRMVKQLVGLEGWEEVVAKYVPDAVLNKLKLSTQQKLS